jgi:hypothetical protein
LRLGYRGRRRKLIKLLNRPLGQLLTGLIDNLKKVSNRLEKGKKCRLKAPAKATFKKTAVVRPTGSREPQGAVAGAPAIQSRRGRAMKTPKRYL